MSFKSKLREAQENHRPNVSGPDMDDLLMEAEDEFMPVIGSPRQIGADMYSIINGTPTWP